MKKLVMLIMFVGLLVMPLSVSAGQCERYWDELVEQSFMTTIDDVDYTLYFGDSVFGPCPCGNVNFSYMDIQDINDISSMVSFDFVYDTSPDVVMIEGLNFVLVSGRLILLPEGDFLIFDIVDD